MTSHTRRNFLRSVGIGTAAAALASHRWALAETTPACTGSHSFPNESATIPAATRKTLGKPNVVFILADDWGYGDVKILGGDRCKIPTPCTDKIAKDGMIFTNGHSTSGVCTPSRYSVLMGRYNWRTWKKTGVLQGYSKPLMSTDRMTVPKFLKTQGYNTGIVGKWHLGLEMTTTDGKGQSSRNVDWKKPLKITPNNYGFDYSFIIPASLDMSPYIYIKNKNFLHHDAPLTKKSFPGIMMRSGLTAKGFSAYSVLGDFTKEACGFIDRSAKDAKAGKPFFLYMPLNSPHTPIAPAKEFQGKSPLGHYGDFVIETDHRIGQVMDTLKRNGLEENTLVIITADNGCSPAALRKNSGKVKMKFNMGGTSHDPAAHSPCGIYRGHKADAYEGGHRVPFIARWPKAIKAGTSCGDAVCQVDLMATCADILGAKLPADAGVDSVSFLPDLLQTAKGPVREALVHHSINGSFAIQQGKWKLILCPGSGGWSKPRPGSAWGAARKAADGKLPTTFDEKLKPPFVQLFDIQANPQETKDLAAEHPAIVKKLGYLLKSYIDNGRSTPGPKQQDDKPTNPFHAMPKSTSPKPKRRKKDKKAKAKK